jgi:hypothetical protein
MTKTTSQIGFDTLSVGLPLINRGLLDRFLAYADVVHNDLLNQTCRHELCCNSMIEHYVRECKETAHRRYLVRQTIRTIRPMVTHRIFLRMVALHDRSVGINERTPTILIESRYLRSRFWLSQRPPRFWRHWCMRLWRRRLDRLILRIKLRYMRKHRLF